MERKHTTNNVARRFAIDLKSFGDRQTTHLGNTLFLLNKTYRYTSMMSLEPLKVFEHEYVVAKVERYWDALKKVALMWIKDEKSRQLIVKFDQANEDPEHPDCFVCLQFQVHNGCLYVSVYMRSQDVEKINMDSHFMFDYAKRFLSLISIESMRIVVDVTVGNLHRYI